MTSINEDERVVKNALASLSSYAPEFQGLQHPGQAPRPAGFVRQPIFAAASVAAVAIGAYLLVDQPWDSSIPQAPVQVAESGDANPSLPTSAESTELSNMEDVRSVADRLARYEESGYGRIALDFATRTVTVYWRGEPPAVVESAEGVQPNGVTVVIVPTRYSESDLTAVGKTILTASFQDDAEVLMVLPNEQMSGVIVTTSATADAGKLAREIEHLTGVPVVIEVGEPGIEQPANSR